MSTLVVAVFVPLLFGCSERATEAEPDRPEAVLKRGNGGEPGTLDPARAVDIHAFNILGDLYEGLVTVAADGSLVPGAALRWQHDDTLTRFEFELRDDALWSTGEPVTAMDFVRGLRRLADPATNAPYAPMLANVRGFAEIEAGNADAATLGVSAIDARTLVIELARPGHTLLDVLAMPMAAPVHASIRDGARFDDPESFVGNGPYRLAARRPNDRIRLEANPHHRAASQLGFCAVEYLPVVEPTTELNLFRADELDITQTIPPQQIEFLRERLPGALRIAPQLGVYFIAFDTTEPALANRELRAALSMAIDRPALVALLGRGEQPAWDLLPPGLLDADTAYDWAALDDEARRAQARGKLAGAIGDAPPPTVRLVFDAGDVHERIALAVSDMWRDTLGVETVLDKREWAYFLDTRDRREDWDAMRYAWFADYADAASFLGMFRSGSEHNLPGIADPDYEAALAAAAAATDAAARDAALASAARRANASYAYAPLYFYVSKHLVRPGISGFVDNALDRHPSRFMKPANGAAGCGRHGD